MFLLTYTIQPSNTQGFVINSVVITSQPTLQSHPEQKTSEENNQNATTHVTQNVLPRPRNGVHDSRYTQNTSSQSNTQHMIQQRRHINTHSSTNNSSAVTTIKQTIPQHDSQLTTLTSPRDAQPILHNFPLSATADIVASAFSVLNKNCDQQSSFGTEEDRCNYGGKWDILHSHNLLCWNLNGWKYNKLIYKVIDKCIPDIYILVETHLPPREGIIVNNYTAIIHNRMKTHHKSK